MNYRIINGAVTYGADTILEEINFEIKDQEKVAIVGRNGSGKTTLLKALINNDILSEGTGTDRLKVYQEGIKLIGYLEQINFQDDNITMIDEILKVYKPILEIEKKLENLVIEMQKNSSEELAQEYSKTLDRYEFLNGYTYKKEYETAISKFGFTNQDKNKKISEFSGGQRTKIAFIKLLLSKPDLLILDEPTNHLDITTIEWLEGYLKDYPKAIVIVSHDRMFLNKIVNKIYEIEYGTITGYSGNYEFFEKQKRVNYEKQLKDFEFQQKEIKRLQSIADRFRYKPTKAKMALSKLKQIERMEKKEEPNRYDLKTFKANFEINTQSGNDVLSVEDLEIGYDTVLAKCSFNLYKGQKLGIIGSNGTGKSTLLKTLVGNLNPINGKFEFGHKVELGYFDQQMLGLDPEKTVFEEFSEEFPDLTVTEVRNSLAAFMFVGQEVFKKVNMLSGGEKVRLSISKILKKGPNLLILDEPTNHMDIIGKETLENMLKEYQGTLIFVSHDRFFVNKIADSILSFENGKVKYYPYGYEYYLEKREETVEESSIQKNDKVIKQTYTNPLKEKGKLERKIKKIEEEISKREEEICSLQKELEKEEIYSDYIKVGEIQSKIDSLNQEIQENMILWEEYQEKMTEFSTNC